MIEESVYQDVKEKHPSLATKMTLLQKGLAEQEEMVAALDQKLRMFMRPEETEATETDRPEAVKHQSPMADEIDLLYARIRRHNAILQSLLYRVEA